MKPGSFIWGFIPISSFPVDLRLEQSSGLSSHWYEVSDHRSAVIPFYQRYITVTTTPSSDTEAMAWVSALRPVWEASYLLNRFVFATGSGDDPIYPLPHLGLQWSTKAADLQKSMIISLGASSKT